MKHKSIKATHKELCNQALKHYETIAWEVSSWNSVIPKAIKFYKENKKEMKKMRREDQKVASFIKVNQDTLWHSLMIVEELMNKLKELRKNLREMNKIKDETKECKL